MNVYEAALKRRSIRLFRETPVPYELLEKCVDTARLAPSVVNLQALEFLVIDDAEKLQRISKNVAMVRGYSSGIVRAGFEQQPKAYIITLVNKRWASQFGGSRMSFPYDIGMANENMMLFATSEGLATCPILSYNTAKLYEILELPEHYQIGMVLAIGYPAESSVAEEMTNAIAFDMDAQGTRHVPKRTLKDVLHYDRIN